MTSAGRWARAPLHRPGAGPLSLPQTGIVTPRSRRPPALAPGPRLALSWTNLGASRISATIDANSAGPYHDGRGWFAMSAQKTVLLVDDDNEIIESMRTVLEAKGYRVMVARDGNAGLTVAERENPDLIILDMMMPKKSGLPRPGEAQGPPGRPDPHDHDHRQRGEPAPGLRRDARRPRLHPQAVRHGEARQVGRADPRNGREDRGLTPTPPDDPTPGSTGPKDRPHGKSVDLFNLVGNKGKADKTRRGWATPPIRAVSHGEKTKSAKRSQFAERPRLTILPNEPNFPTAHAPKPGQSADHPRRDRDYPEQSQSRPGQDRRGLDDPIPRTRSRRTKPISTSTLSPRTKPIRRPIPRRS